MFHTELKREEGASSIEYAVLGSLIGVAILAALMNLGGVTGAFYDVVAALVNAAI